MVQACIGIGSNLGDRPRNIQRAVEGLRSLPGAGAGAGVRLSPVYETAPVGPIAQGPFLNAVAVLQTRLSAVELAKHLQRIEEEAGREPLARREKWGPRVLDLDLLLYGDQVVDTPDLVVPHPRLHERWFVLKPLADLVPEAVHPLLGRTIAELLAQCDASS